MRKAAQTILVEFWEVGRVPRKEFIIGLDLLQAPVVGEFVKFAKVEGFSDHNFVVSNVQWYVGVTDSGGRTVSPEALVSIAFQTAQVEIMRQMGNVEMGHVDQD